MNWFFPRRSMRPIDQIKDWFKQGLSYVHRSAVEPKSE